MSEKRFAQRLYETGEHFLEDNETDCFYEVNDNYVHIEVLCERLNKIVDENEQLKQRNSRLMMEVAEYSRELRRLKGDVALSVNFFPSRVCGSSMVRNLNIAKISPL